MELSQIKAIIFDMDGVLLDSETISWKTWEIAAKEKNIPDIASANAACMGRNRPDTVAILQNIYGKDFDGWDFLNRTSDLFYQIENQEGIPLMPYAKEALEYLQSKYTLALASSTRKSKVYRQLKAAGLFDFFKTLTCGDMVSHSKPDPEIYLTACASINLSPSQCIAVEDSPNGIKSSTSANIPTIMIPDKIKPDSETISLCFKILPSLKDLCSFL